MPGEGADVCIAVLDVPVVLEMVVCGLNVTIREPLKGREELELDGGVIRSGERMRGVASVAGADGSIIFVARCPCSVHRMGAPMAVGNSRRFACDMPLGDSSRLAAGVMSAKLWCPRYLSSKLDRWRR